MPGTTTTFAKKTPTLTFEYLLLDPWCFLPAVSRVFPYAVNSFIVSFIDPCKRACNSNIFQPNPQKQHITKFDSPLFLVFKPSRRACLHHFRSVSLILRQHNDGWVGECMNPKRLCPDLRVTDGGIFIDSDPFGL